MQIPVDENGGALVPYRGRAAAFPTSRSPTCCKDRVDPGELKGKIALVGTTAPALLDMRATPVASVYPGVEIHANMIAGILDEDGQADSRRTCSAPRSCCCSSAASRSRS